jgi:hypothetical protein
MLRRVGLVYRCAAGDDEKNGDEWEMADHEGGSRLN